MSAALVGPFRFPLDLLTAALGDPGLTKAAMRLIGVVVDHAATKGHCFLSDATIGELIGLHRVTIRRAGELLLRLGWISRIERGAHRGKATVYVLPLERDPAPESAALGATLSVPGDPPADPESAAPPHEKAPRHGTGKRRAAAQRQPIHGTHDGTHHGQAPHGSGFPDRTGTEASGPPIPRPPAEAGVRQWVGWALDVAASGAGLTASIQAASEAAGATFGRLGSKCPEVIRKSLREAMGGSEADRARLLEAATNADHLLKLGKPAKEAGIRFGAIWKGTARPHYEPAPGSEAAEVLGRPEPGTVRRRPVEKPRGGELFELARTLAPPDPTGGMMAFTVGHPDPTLPPAGPERRPWVPPDRAELDRKLSDPAGRRDRLARFGISI
jgi:hypothetical protein